MPFINTLGPGATLASTVLAGDSIPSYWPSVYQQPRLLVILNGNTVLNHVIGATISYGLDVGIASATIELTEVPVVGDYSKFSLIQIYCDASLTIIDPPLRFTGYYLHTRATLDPHVWQMICRGTLYLADQYRQASFIAPYPYSGGPVPPSVVNQSGVPVGQALIPLTLPNGTVIPGLTPNPTATDQEIVLAILNRVPGLQPFVDPAKIGGTGKVFGRIAYLDLVWPPYRSALSQIQQFDQVCLGYRVFESLGGQIHRSQIYGYPSSIADTTFTEGIDIWSGQGDRSIETLINGCIVEGSPTSLSTANGLIFDYVQQSNPFQAESNPVIDQFSSPLIETCSFMIAAGINVDAMSAYDVALWRLSERNRELVNYQLTTFRDAMLYPGRSIALNSPHMGVTEPVWMQHIEIRVSSDPALFQQTITGVGGGLPDYTASAPDYTPPLDPGDGFSS